MSDGTSDASLYCTLCAVRCLNASSWASHLSGKKHKRNLSRSLPADSRSAGDVPNQSGPGVLVSAACSDQQATTFVTNQVARFLVHEIPKLWAGPNVATGVLVRVSQDSLDQVRALNPLVRPADHPILTYTVAEVLVVVRDFECHSDRYGRNALHHAVYVGLIDECLEQAFVFVVAAHPCVGPLHVDAVGDGTAQ